MKLSDAEILQGRGFNFNPVDLYQNRTDDLLKRIREIIQETLRGFEKTQVTFEKLGEEVLMRLYIKRNLKKT